TPLELERASVPVEQPPMSPDRPLELALPGLVVGLNHIDPVVLQLGEREHIMQHARLIDWGWPRALAHAARAWPAELADEHLLVGERRRHLLADVVNMLRRIGGGDWKVLPVRENVDGDEINRGSDLAIPQPELPDIRVGYRHGYLRLNLTDRAGELWGRHLPPQQHLIADNDGRDHIRVALGKRHRPFNLLAAQIRKAREPQALHDLEAMAARHLWNLVEPMVDRIGADATRHLLELGEVLFDLADINGNVGAERVLLPPKRRIGNALKLLAWADRRLRHFDRHPKPGPGRNDDPCHCGKHRSREGHTSALHSGWLPSWHMSRSCYVA